MKTTDRQKMCTQCDGRVPLEATECPFCAHAFAEPIKTSPLNAPLFKNQTLQESLASLYTPPYAGAKNAEKAPPPLKKKLSEFKEAPQPMMNIPTVAKEENSGEETKKDFWVLFALIVGANLLTLGLLQFFFSEGGTLQLEWDSSYWYLYCLIALPLFYFGIKKLNSEKAEAPQP
jgi:hypothetical protein